MTTSDLQLQQSSKKAQIIAKLTEIANDDTDVQKLYAELFAIEQQLVASEAHDQTVIDRTNRKTDAALGTSAR